MSEIAKFENGKTPLSENTFNPIVEKINQLSEVRRGTSSSRDNNNTVVKCVRFGLVGSTLNIWANE